MRALWNRSAVFTAAAVTAAALAIGCKTDIDQANEAAALKIDASTVALGNGGADQAAKDLGALTAQSNLSPSSKISASLALAKANEALAQAKIDETQGHQTKIAGLMQGLERLSGQIATNNANVLALTSLNPTGGQQAFTAQADAAEKGAGGAWVPGQPPLAPILSANDAKAKADELDKQIKTLTDERTQVAAKRALALDEANKLSQQADAAQGSSASGFFVQSSTQRKDAKLGEIKIHDLDAQILPLQQQLDVLKAQVEGGTAAATTSRDQAAKLGTGWEGVQKQIEAVKEYSVNLLDGKGSVPASVAPAGAAATSQPAQPQTIVAIATELDQEIKAAAEARNAAIELLDKSYKLYEDASKQATTLLGALPKSTPENRTLPEKKAWDALAALHAKAEFQLGQSGVLSTLAKIYSSQFIELQERNAVVSQLNRALKQSGIDTPGAVTALGEPGSVPDAVKAIQADLQKADFTAFEEAHEKLVGNKDASIAGQEAVASALADLYYGWSDSVNNEVLNVAGSGELGTLRTNLAHLSKMTSDYGWYQLASAQHVNPAQRLAFSMTEFRALYEGGKALIPASLPPEFSVPSATQPAAGAPGAPGAPTAAPGDATTTTQPADAAAATPATPPAPESRPAGQ